MKIGVKIGLTLLLAVAFRATHVRADSHAPELSLDRIIESVKRYHPLLRASEEGKRQAMSELLSAEGAFDTSASAELSSYATGYYDGTAVDTEISQPLMWNGARLYSGFRNSSGSFPVYDDYLYTGEIGEARAGIQLPLARDREIDKPRTQLIRASLLKVVAEANIEQRKIELIRGASIAFFSWSAAGERWKIAADLLKVAESRGRQISERVRRGDLPQFDLDDNERAILQRRAVVLSSERALQKTALDLSLFLRNEDGEPILPTIKMLLKTFPSPKKIEIKQSDEAHSRRPELKRLEAEMQRNDADLKLAENQLLPKVDLLTGFSNDIGESSHVSSQGELKIGLKFQLPLQNREAKGRRELALSKERELKLLQRFTKDKITTEVKDAENSVFLAEQRFNTAKREHELAKELQQGEVSRYELGDSNLIFVNLREQTTAEAATRVVDALYDYSAAIAEFEAATAKEAAQG